HLLGAKRDLLDRPTVCVETPEGISRHRKRGHQNQRMFVLGIEDYHTTQRSAPWLAAFGNQMVPDIGFYLALAYFPASFIIPSGGRDLPVLIGAGQGTNDLTILRMASYSFIGGQKVPSGGEVGGTTHHKIADFGF